MNNITISDILTILAAITAIVSFYSMVKKLIDEAFEKQLKPLKKDVELTLEAQLQMMTHIIDGNHVDKLRDLRNKVEKELVDRKYE